MEPEATGCGSIESNTSSRLFPKASRKISVGGLNDTNQKRVFFFFFCFSLLFCVDLSAEETGKGSGQRTVGDGKGMLWGFVLEPSELLTDFLSAHYSKKEAIK